LRQRSFRKIEKISLRCEEHQSVRLAMSDPASLRLADLEAPQPDTERIELFQLGLFGSLGAGERDS
jgi:hypothetical protein